MPMLSLDNAFDDDGFRRVLRPRAALPRARSRTRSSTFVGRAEDRRALGQPELRGRRFVRGATRGDGRTGEDVTANLRTMSGPAASARHGAGADRNPRRGLHDQGRFPRPQRGAGEAAGEKIFANPRNAAAGSLRQLDVRDHRRAAAVASSPMPGARRASHSPRRTGSICERLQRLGLRGQPAVAAARRRRRRLPAFQAEIGARARRPRPTTSTASSTRSTTSRCRRGSASSAARRAGRSRANSPPSRRRPCCRTSRIQVGRTGALTPVARLSRSTSAACGAARDPAQRGRDRAQGRAHRRHRDRAARRRRDPADPRSRRSSAARRTRRPTSSRTTARPAAASRCAPPGEAVRRCTGGLICPAQARRAADAFRLAPRLRHRGARREDDPGILGGRLAAQPGRHLPPARARGGDRRSARAGASLSAQPGRGDRGAPPHPARPLHLRARHPPHRRGDRAAAGAPLRHASPNWRAQMPAAVQSAPRRAATRQHHRHRPGYRRGTRGFLRRAA